MGLPPKHKYELACDAATYGPPAAGIVFTDRRLCTTLDFCGEFAAGLGYSSTVEAVISFYGNFAKCNSILLPLFAAFFAGAYDVL